MNRFALWADHRRIAAGYTYADDTVTVAWSNDRTENMDSEAFLLRVERDRLQIEWLDDVTD